MFYLKDYEIIKESDYSCNIYKPSTLVKECLGMMGKSKEEIGNRVLSHIHNKGKFKEATIEYTDAGPIVRREHWANSSIIELVLISLDNFSHYIKDVKVIWYFNKDYSTVNILEVFKGDSIISTISLKKCAVELVQLYAKYYSLPRNSKERLLLRNELNMPDNSNRNRMGCAESQYDFEYAMMQTFSKEEIENMSDTEFAHLKRLVSNIQEGLY